MKEQLTFVVNKIYNHPNTIYYVAFFSSLLLSLLAYSMYDQVVKRDSFLYISQSIAFNKAGLSAALEIYPWPWYAILVAYTQKILHLSYINAALLLTSLSLAIFSTAFVHLLKLLKAEQLWQWLGLFILFSFSDFYEMRTQVLRDPHYAVAVLLATVLLIRFVQTKKWLYFLGGLSFFALATLFRIEGLFFLAVAPVCIFALQISWKMRLKLLVITFLSFVGCFLLVYLVLKTVFDASLFLKLQPIWHGVVLLIENYQIKAQLFGDVVLKDAVNADWYASSTLAGGLLFYFVHMEIAYLSILFTLLTLYGLIFRSVPAAENGRRILVIFLLANIVLLLVYLFIYFFITSRYAFFLNWLLLLWAIFALRDISLNWQQRVTPNLVKFKKPLLIICFSIIAVFFVKSLLPDPSHKIYQKKAGIWLKENTPANTSVFSREAAVSFYAERPILTVRNWCEFYKINWMTYDYLAIKMNGERLARDQAIYLTPLHDLTPLASFKNKRNDQIVIYKTPKERAENIYKWPNC